MDSDLTDKDKALLLGLARSAIRAKLAAGARVERAQELSPGLLEKRGCFVTLQKAGQLRGCIGTIEPVQPLWEAVEANALNAAFRDPRFPPLSTTELAAVVIEVSVLTVPRPLPFTSPEDLKRQLRPGVHGVILSRGRHRSTFLPQVWDQLPDKETFLTHLCQKGGMGSLCWKDPETEVQVYEAEHFSE